MDLVGKGQVGGSLGFSGREQDGARFGPNVCQTRKKIYVTLMHLAHSKFYICLWHCLLLPNPADVMQPINTCKGYVDMRCISGLWYSCRSHMGQQRPPMQGTYGANQLQGGNMIGSQAMNLGLGQEQFSGEAPV